MNVRTAFIAWGFALGLTAVGCGSSDSGGGGGGGAATTCADDPFICPAGQTCWPTPSGAFACLNSAAGVAVGASCFNTMGQPTCGDTQLCFQQTSGTAGACVAYCSTTDAAHGCAAGSVCGTLLLGAVQTHACVSTGGAAGAGGGAGSDAGDEASAGSGGSDAAAD